MLTDLMQAIVGYRETEKGKWKNSLSLSAIKNLQDRAVNAVSGKVLQPLPLIHVLDLAEDGYELHLG